MPSILLRALAALLLTGLVCCCSAQRAESKPEGPKRLALLVAIDAYGARATPDVAAEDQWKALAGTGNDVEALGAELRRRGYDVTVLRDAKATRQGIIDAFRERLVAKARQGDHVWFHYSGHGQQVPDDNGAPDERDGYDEALVPYDNKGLRDYSRHLRDDTLGELLAELTAKTSNVVVSLDSCHAGTGTRAGIRNVRGAMPMHAPAATRGAGDDGVAPAAQARGFTFLAAARPHQFAGEARVGGKVMGAFTYLLVGALRRAGTRTTFREVLDRVGVKIRRLATNQDPDGEGDLDRYVFGEGFSEPPSYFRVLTLEDDGRVPVEAGSLHGLSKGSVLAVFPLEAKLLDPEVAPARLEITAVELGRAWGTPKDDTTGGALFAAGAKAVEVFSVVPPDRVRLWIDPAVSEPRVRPSGLKAVEVVNDRAAADLSLTAAGPGAVQITRTDGSVVPFPVRAQVAPEPTLALTAPQLTARVEAALEAEYRKNRLLAMENDDRRTRLDVSLEVRQVDAVLEDGRPKVTATRGVVDKGGRGELAPGDVIQLVVNNRGRRDAYVSVLALNPDGSVDVLYPPAGSAASDSLVKAGEERALEQLALMTPPSGTQYFKLVATEKPVDLSALKLKTGFRAAQASTLGGWVGPIMNSARAVPFGTTVRERWGTDAVRFEIVE